MKRLNYAENSWCYDVKERFPLKKNKIKVNKREEGREKGMKTGQVCKEKMGAKTVAA